MSLTSANVLVSDSPLADRCPLPPSAAVRVFEQLLNQVAASHSAGSFHGNLTVDSIIVGDGEKTMLPDRPLEFSFNNEADLTEVCPPELQADPPGRLPTQIVSARDQLRNSGNACDPIRIDIYQLGAVLCRLMSGRPVSEFLQSVKARSKVPIEFREVIDSALGYAAESRIGTLEQLASRFTTAAQFKCASAFSETPVARAKESAAAATPAGGVESISQNTMLSEGYQLAQYRIVKHIGSGGMGDVYQAFDTSLDRDVAIKVLPLELARHEDFVRRFRAEATAVAKLVHPNIVQIHTIGEHSGHHYFAMQFVNGHSLAELLNERGRLSVDETLAIIEQCLAGLKAAHDLGMTHRDIKPGNILLSREQNRALVADFGLVKASTNENSLTVTGTIMGTVDYISPEQARGAPIDGRADLYSLGVLMYQMLSGRLPFEASSSTALIFKHAYEQPRLLSETAPHVPRRIVAIVARLMAKDPANRYQNTAEVAADLAAFRTGRPPAIPRRAVSGGSSLVAQMESASNSTGYDPLSDSDQELAIGNSTLDSLKRRMTPWHDRLWAMLHRKAPLLADKFGNTLQQVDGAIIEYERRHDELTQLTSDAEEAETEMVAQMASHQEAARETAQRVAGANPETADRLRQDQLQFEQIAADFAVQLKEHRAQSTGLRKRLAEVTTTLKQLRSRRDLLQLRLRTAQARIQLETGSPGRSRTFPRWAIAAVLLAVAAFWFTSGLFPGPSDTSKTDARREASDKTVAASTSAAKLPPFAAIDTLPAKLTGRFYILVRGRFDLFVNQQQVKFNGSISDPVVLQQGDIVFLRARSAFFADYRGIKLDFVSDDGSLAWPARPEEFKIVEASGPEAVNAGILNEAQQSPAVGRATPAMLAEWAKLDPLAGSECELMWSGGQNQWWQCAALVQANYFLKSTGPLHSPPVVTATAAPPSTEEPPIDTVEFKGNRYKLFLKRGINWDDAETACEKLGGHLACPITPEQMQFIDKLKDGKAVWLGGYFDADAQPPTWKWVTGQALDRKPPAKNSTDLWIATLVGDKTGIIGRAHDGTLRRPDGTVMHALNTNILGYICEWSAHSNDSASQPAESTARANSHSIRFAVAPFRERGEGVQGLGARSANLLAGTLAKESAMTSVNQEDITGYLAQQGFSPTTLISPDEARKIASATGATFVVTGSVFEADRSIHLVAKIVGTKTEYGATAAGLSTSGIEPVTAQLAKEIVKIIQANAAQF
jgi:serine/threonine protein kinase/TolB-like protein